MKRHLSILLWCMTIFSCPVGADAQRVSYHSAHLVVAAKQLDLTTKIDTLCRGTSFLDIDGNDVEVRINEDWQVEHIGIPLFPPTIRTTHPSPIYDFLEYALLDNIYGISQNPFTYTSVAFQKGSWGEIPHLRDSASWEVNTIDRKYYKIKWADGKGNALVDMIFPVSYDMLAGATRKELELNFVRDLRRFVGKSPSEPFAVDSTRLQALGDSLWVMKGGHYVLENITDDVYLRKENDTLHILNDSSRPDLTLSNMILADDASVPECYILVRFCLYAGTSDSLLLPMRTFVRYCRSKGAHAYFGQEKNDSKEITASLFFYDNAAGYDHVVYLKAPKENFAGPEYTLTGLMYLYAPTSNVENLFYHSKNEKKNIVYEN